MRSTLAAARSSGSTTRRFPTPGRPKVCCGLKNRGVAAWLGKIYVGTLDGRLVAIDARTGSAVWSVLTIDASWRYAITGAPRVAKGMVLIGNAGAEYGVRGYIGAYDAETGRLLWRFYTVPGTRRSVSRIRRCATPQRRGAASGGGSVAAAPCGTRSSTTRLRTSSTSARRTARLGISAIAILRAATTSIIASIVAVDADTGDYVWHYQATPGDTWDYDSTSSLTIADLSLDGRTRHVVMQANKNGFFYVLDASTGELLRAQAFTQMNWADGVEMTTGRPRVRPEARYGAGQRLQRHTGTTRGSRLAPECLQPANGTLVHSHARGVLRLGAGPAYMPSDTGYNLGIDLSAGNSYYQTHPNAPRGFQSFLQAWDPVAGTRVWRGESNQGPTGGALATAGGLVFQGGGSAQEFRAYDASTGAKLWSTQAQTGIFAGPISYEVDGRQYIAVTVGSGASNSSAPNLSRLLVFALNGTAQLPP